jgi:hypothetical protein
VYVCIHADDEIPSSTDWMPLWLKAKKSRMIDVGELLKSLPKGGEGKNTKGQVDAAAAEAFFRRYRRLVDLLTYLFTYLLTYLLTYCQTDCVIGSYMHVVLYRIHAWLY